MHPNKPHQIFPVWIQKVITCNHHLSVVLLCKLLGGLEAVFLHEKRKLLLSAARSTLIACMYCSGAEAAAKKWRGLINSHDLDCTHIPNF